MSKKIKNNLEKVVMSKVRSNKITMKPRWYFVVGGVLSFIGLIFFTTGAVYFTNLLLFLLRKHGPMGEYRLQQILATFPWWIPILAIVGIISGIYFLKKYDFSYKKNLWLIIVGFIIAIIIAALTIDSLGINDLFARQGPMRGFYRQVQGQNQQFQRGHGEMRRQGIINH